MTNKVRLFPPAFRILDAAGLLITTGAKIYVYEPTSTTPAITYSDALGGTQLANPYIVPATGIADMWGTYATAYRIVVKTPTDVTLADIDNVVGVPDYLNIAVLGDITTGTLTATTINGTLLGLTTDNATNNGITNVITITHTTSGTPANGIGTGIAFKSESADESPSDVGGIGFAFSDVTGASEDSYFRIFTRVAGAAIKKAYDMVVTGAGDYVFTGAPTATRIITLPDSDFTLALPSRVAPTIQKFLSGSGTYTTPAGVLYIRVRMIGGGGGGAGSSTNGALNGGTGGTGVATTFGTSLLTANGGVGAQLQVRGAGGTATLGTGPIGVALTGGAGTGNTASTLATGYAGGCGASSPFGGGGSGGGTSDIAGGAGPTNTGTGGGGASINITASCSGCGGGAGGYIDAIITAPAATYTYTVGTGGAGGTSGTSGTTGGAGAAGIIVVEEFYQ